MSSKKSPVKKQSLKTGTGIKILREKKGYSQMEFCRKFGFRQSHLSLIESNKLNASNAIQKKVCAVLKVPLVYLHWLSITEEDIAPKKREAFLALKPSIEKMLDEIFEK